MKTQDEKTISLVQFSGTLMGDGFYPTISSNAKQISAIKATAEPNETHVWYANTDHFTQTGPVYSCFGTLYQDDSQPVPVAEGRVLQVDVVGPSEEHPTGQGRWSVGGAIVQDWLDFFQPVVIQAEE